MQLFRLLAYHTLHLEHPFPRHPHGSLPHFLSLHPNATLQRDPDKPTFLQQHTSLSLLYYYFRFFFLQNTYYHLTCYTFTCWLSVPTRLKASEEQELFLLYSLHIPRNQDNCSEHSRHNYQCV